MHSIQKFALPAMSNQQHVRSNTTTMSATDALETYLGEDDHADVLLRLSRASRSAAFLSKASPKSKTFFSKHIPTTKTCFYPMPPQAL